jgi:hypothetical protein
LEFDKQIVSFSQAQRLRISNLAAILRPLPIPDMTFLDKMKNWDVKLLIPSEFNRIM